MVPDEVTDEHHADIAMITDVLGDEGLRKKLRDSTSSSALYKILVEGNGKTTVADQLQTAHGS